MEKLLQWATAQQSDDPEVRARAPAPDPKVLAQVLGADTGKDEVTLMKEDISVVLCDDPRISIDDKLAALEDFELLIQNLDNANNISPMGIWPEINKLYNYQGEEQDEVRGMAALITGTAVQNNSKCQDDYLNIVGKDGMTSLLTLASPIGNYNVRARALYAISALVAHHGGLYKLFTECDGWKILQESLSANFTSDRKDTKVLLRLLNLLKSLLYDEITQHEAVDKGDSGMNMTRVEKPIVATKEQRFQILKEHDIISTILQKLSSDTSLEVNERVINILHYIHEHKYNFSSGDKELLKTALGSISNEKYNAEELKSIQSIII